MNNVFYNAEIYDSKNGGRYRHYLTMDTRANKMTLILWVRILINAFKIAKDRKCELLSMEVIDIDEL